MTAKRIRRAQIWRGRHFGRVLNAALAANGYAFKVRVRPLRNMAGVEVALARMIRALSAAKDSRAWLKLVKFVNNRLALPSGGLERANGTVECVKCGTDVMMLEDPDEWERRKDRRWRVTGYWPGTGECCGLLYADDFECTRVFDLSKRDEPPAAAAGDDLCRTEQPLNSGTMT